MLSVLFYKRCCSYSLLDGRHVSWSLQRKWSQRHSPGSSKSSSNLQSLTSSPPDEAPASMVRDFGFWMDFWLLVTYNNENQKEDKKGQEDELSSALFPHFLFCLNSFYFFFCHVHSDNEGWKEKVLIPAIQWACENCHRWHDPPSCSARLPSNWPRSQDPWRPHGSRGSPAPSSAYHRVWRGKRCHDEFFELKKIYSSVKFSQFERNKMCKMCKISWPYIAVVWKKINMRYEWLWSV